MTYKGFLVKTDIENNLSLIVSNELKYFIIPLENSNHIYQVNDNEISFCLAEFLDGFDALSIEEFEYNNQDYYIVVVSSLQKIRFDSSINVRKTYNTMKHYKDFFDILEESLEDKSIQDKIENFNKTKPSVTKTFKTAENLNNPNSSDS